MPPACIALLALALGACGPGGGDRTAPRGGAGTATGSTAPSLDVTVVVGSRVVGTTTLTVTVERSGAAEVGASVSARGEMTHPGMAPSLATLSETQPGVYVTDDFALPMAGDWILSVSVTAADGARGSSESFLSVAAR